MTETAGINRTGEPIVSVRNLTIGFRGQAGVTPAVRGVSLDIWPGETVALVGESGSGKSVSALSLLKLLPASAEVGGDIDGCGVDVDAASPEAVRKAASISSRPIQNTPNRRSSGRMSPGRMPARCAGPSRATRCTKRRPRTSSVYRPSQG